MVKKHWEYLYIYFCLTILAGGFLTLGVWYFLPIKIITIDPVVKLDKKIYNPGDRLTYTLSYCKYRPIPAIVIRSLVNGTRVNFTDTSANLPLGCHTTNIADLIIPEYADPDIYRIEATVVYQVNPVKKVQFYWKSEDFKVVK